MAKRCLICGDCREHHQFFVREMYYGTREEYLYIECKSCGTLQLTDIPVDLSRHYPSDYYSFSASVKSASAFEIMLRRSRTNAWLGAPTSVTGRLFAKISKRRPEYLEWFEGLGISTNSRILDVGCGSGQLLLRLRRDGFTNLKGIDPFLEQPLSYGPGLNLVNHPVHAERGKYDLVMFHHSLEHMTDPVETLKHAKGLLAANGYVLVRVPLAGCYAWRKYRQHWYAIDAPRHLFIPSSRGMFLLSKEAGLSICRRFFDSGPGELLASENYLHDIPLISQAEAPEVDSKRMKALSDFMKMLNHIGDSDCGGFILEPT